MREINEGDIANICSFILTNKFWNYIKVVFLGLIYTYFKKETLFSIWASLLRGL